MPPLGFQSRASQRVLAKHGQDSLLRGEAAGKVAITRYVDEFPGIGDTAMDNPMVNERVAAIDSTYSPKVGDLLVHPDGSFKLTRRLTNNGFIERFFIVET